MAAEEKSLVELIESGTLKIELDAKFDVFRDFNVFKFDEYLNIDKFDMGHFGNNSQYQDKYNTNEEIKTNKIYENDPVYRNIFKFTPTKLGKVYSFNFRDAKNFFKLNVFSGNNDDNYIVSFNSPVENHPWMKKDMIEWVWNTKEKALLFRVSDTRIINREHKFIIEYTK